MVGWGTSNTFLAEMTCNNGWDDVTYASYGWGSDNPPVAQVANAHTSLMSIGNANGSGWADILWGNRLKTCPTQPHTATAPNNSRTVTQSPSTINMSNGDANVAISVTINGPNGILAFATGLLSNLNSSSQASISIPGNNNAGGTANYTISVAGSNSPSGVFGATACVSGACAHQGTTINIPPQILIQMMYAEANGTNSTAMSADGDVVRNRFGSAIFNPPYNTYQNTIVSGQFAFNTSITTGVQPELLSAANVFTRAGGNFCSSLAFWTPTPTQWQAVQAAINSQTTTFPTGTGAPVFGSSWPASQQQILYVSTIGNQGNGAPNFLYLTMRNSNQPAAISTSCTP